MSCLLRFIDTVSKEHLSIRRNLSAAGIVTAGPTGPQCSKAHYLQQARALAAWSRCPIRLDPTQRL
jgi:hypothetical protein